MFFSDFTFLGIDPTAGQRPFHYVALDGDLSLLAIGEGPLEEVLAFAAGQRQALAAICAPRRPNQGLLAREEFRSTMSPAPRPGRWTNFRLAEYELYQQEIYIPQTRRREEECPGWMRMGFALYRRLEKLGYRPYPSQDSERQFLEVYPHAAFAGLLGVLPFPKDSLEGRLQRQLVLYERKLKIGDPMRIFEEITRFRLLKGILPTEDLYTPGELDALVAAFTAWMVAHHPDKISQVGDPEEGQIVLPVPQINLET